MDKSQIIALFDREQRIDTTYPDMQREATPYVVRHVNISGIGEGIITHSRLNETNVDEVIRRQIDYFKRIGQDFEWKLYDYDRPADLKKRLAAFGFTIEEAEALVVLDLEDAPQNLRRLITHDIQRITDAGKLVDVQRVEERVWGEDSSWVVDFLGNALREYPNRMSVYVAYVAGEPVSAAWIYFPQSSQFASLWGGATVEHFRRRGFYTDLLAVRAQEAQARGVRYLTVDASPMSRPILEKHGFEMLAYTYPCKWRHKPKSISG